MMRQRPRLPVISGLILLSVRGVLLWIVIPISMLIWILGWPVWRRKAVGLGQLLGWADLNLVCCIHHSVLRPFVRNPIRWTPLAEMPQVTHRIGLIDPA